MYIANAVVFMSLEMYRRFMDITDIHKLISFNFFP